MCSWQVLLLLRSAVARRPSSRLRRRLLRPRSGPPILSRGFAVVGTQLIAQDAISGPNAATLSLVINSAEAALTAFTSLQPGHTSTTAVAADVVVAIEKLVPLLPTQPELAAAIDVGLAVLAAFMQSTPMRVPAVPTALRRVAMLHRRIG